MVSLAVSAAVLAAVGVGAALTVGHGFASNTNANRLTPHTEAQFTYLAHLKSQTTTVRPSDVLMLKLGYDDCDLLDTNHEDFKFTLSIAALGANDWVYEANAGTDISRHDYEAVLSEGVVNLCPKHAAALKEYVATRIEP